MAATRRPLEATPSLESPIERRKLYDQIAERLLHQISSRRLKPGDFLPTERELTQWFRVGRSTVREALRMLESQGLIRSIGKGQFAVAHYGNPLNHSLNLLLTVQQADLRELFEVRKFLEVECAGLAAARRKEHDLATMRAAIEEMVAGVASQDRYIAADLQFHLTVAAATRNRVAAHMMEAVRGLLQHALASIYHIPSSPLRSIAQHRKILAAIAEGNAVAARRHMREHLVRVEGDIKSMLSGPVAVARGAGRG